MSGLVTIQAGNTEEILASDVDACEIDEIREWFSYTKPIGHDVTIAGRSTPVGALIFSMRSTGNKAGATDQADQH